MDDSQLFGASEMVPVAAKGVDSIVGIETGVAAGMGACVKRRRGRPPRAMGNSTVQRPHPPPAEKRKKDEEDVCFICFDGGSLVLCDRRGCPKAYHPSCIKRDEAFFRSKAKWNCGWHICSSCQKASLYMCYTCTYSLCKGCTKGADYVCVRGNKGFCGTCMRTIMLIENIAMGNKETVEVDFDDQTSWEYLFKVYWIYLKTKLSLTLDELSKAKNPWRGDELPKVKNSWKGAATMSPNVELSGHSFLVNDDKASCIDKCWGKAEDQSKRRKTSLKPNVPNEGSFGIEEITPLPQGTTWATKELLEFVSHMKNGDISMLSQFEVQALLLEYIKRNNLRDPRQKSHILCDSRLMSLFGKSRVGHFEMLKLLEYHFFLEEKSPANNIVRVGAADVVSSQEFSNNYDNQLMTGNAKRRKTRKKTDERGPVANYNLNDYAAIDVHNIGLLYLKRDLVENLLDDAEKFREKVSGSFVRIRISCGDQKQDIYRLVQVIGTSTVTESYLVGTRTTNIMLEILNLDKKEIISIDGISNQEFSEDECKRLCQSIKCGLIKRLKVGEIQQKAMVLQAVKTNDGLEAEILRLNHLRDRANEKGRRKELRECVEKLEILKSPKERNRRLLEIPIVHPDQRMEPSYESGEDGEANGMKRGKCSRSRNGDNNKKGLDINSSLGALDVLSEVGIMEQRNLAATCQTRDICTAVYEDRDGNTQVHEKVNNSIPSQGGEALNKSQNLPNNQIAPGDSRTGYSSSHTVIRADQSSGSATAVVPPPLTVRELSINDSETNKLWHYQDPTGKIQGPFPMMQLRKWSTSGHFPSDLRVWRINEKQDDAILLTDALIGQFHEQSQLPQDKFLLPHGVAAAMDDTNKKWEQCLGRNSFATLVDNNNSDPGTKTVENDGSVQCKVNKLMRSDEWPSLSSSRTTAMSVAMGDDRQAPMSVQGWDLKRGVSTSADQAQVCSSFFSSSSSVKLPETPACHVEGHGNENCSRICNLNDNSHKSSEGQTSTWESNEKQADSEGHSSQSSGRNWRPSPKDDSSSRWDSSSKPNGKSKQNQEIDLSDLPSPTPKQSHPNLEEQTAEGKQSIASNAPVLESGPSWSTTSSLVTGGAQLPEVAGEWSGYSSAPIKTPVEDWDSNLASASSLKPIEGANNHAATSTSGIDHFTHSSSANLAVDSSGWQPVPESNEFSLVDESVSDLLAEVEAMESLGGLQSPTSKMRCAELTQDSDDDCFSPVEGFSPALDPGKSDAFSSTGDIQMSSQITANDDPLRLRLFDMPSHTTVTDEPIKVSQVPSKLMATDQPHPHNASRVPARSIVIGEPICASETSSSLVDELHRVANVPSQSTVTDKPLEMSQKPSESSLCDEAGRMLHAETIVPQKNRSGQSSSGHVPVKKLDTGTEIQPPSSSSVSEGDKVSDMHPSALFTVSQWEARSDVQNSASPNEDTRSNNAMGICLGGKNMDWGAGHASANAASSTGNTGGLGNQPRCGGDRYGGTRDHRNYQGRDSSYGRERSYGWWNRQPFTSGVSFRSPPKGQRICKFHESGFCRKGESCSYWHP
ncbi:hypothetical protein K2173_006089 [Erythroxylum novogranatense]|uniref:Zinc finger CCCH domain-containing protein 44 n=1 Tax=Erythroxylum novogranatense TaxID=1862640 RepID=A0AAV8TDF4_9ROSI|nr:hypothetical protein K2173_006089 [Erythroxylum novogranatense]